MSEKTSEKKTTPRQAIAILLVIAAFAGLLFAVSTIATPGCSEVSGRLTTSGSDMGDFTFEATRCRSGQRGKDLEEALDTWGGGASFFGVTLLGDEPDDGAVILSIGENHAPGKPDARVTVRVPGSCSPPDSHDNCKEVLLENLTCDTLDAHVENTGNRRNRIALVRGHLSMSCTLAGGGMLETNFEFDDCD